MKFIKIALLGALLTLSLPLVANAKALPNKLKGLQTQMNKCQTTAKKYSNLGYPAKAEKQLKSCNQIKKQIAQVKKGQAKVNRKIASMSTAKKKHAKAKKHAKKKHKKKQPVESSDIQ